MTPTRTGLALCAALFSVLLSAPAVAQEGPPAVFDRTEVPAAVTSRVVLDVSRFGRYAITASSDQGVSLELVDRMAGPGEAAGVAGERDGRLDLILDRSQYLLVARGHERATGTARLEVRPFEELHGDPAPELPELKLVSAPLGDLEQRSYWLKVGRPRWMTIEAAGRHLRDLRLWRDGTWLVEAEPQAEVIEPEVGSPQLALRLQARLEPGTYLLTAYGGESQPWASGGREQPFSLRWGIPSAGAAGRRRLEVGPFGYDRVLVPRQATLYRLELPEARPAALEVTPWDEEVPFAGPEQRNEITTSSREPVAELETAWEEEGFNLVTVRGVAGQPYLLEHFDSRPSYRFSEGGTYWLSTVHTGHPADAVDVTAVLVEWRQGSLVKEPRAEQVVALDREHGYSRRCNLLDTLDLFVRVGEAGAYRVDLEGVEARFRFEPFLVYRPRNYQEPRLRPAGASWDLDPGLYTLTVAPEEYGVVTVTIHHAEGPDPEGRPPRAMANLGPLQLSTGSRYELYLNRQPGVKAGLVLRPWNETLATPLPLSLRPGEEVTSGWHPMGDGEVVAVAEDGSPLELKVDDRAWVEHRIAGGSGRSVTVRSPGREVVAASLRFVPRLLLDATPLPPLPATDLPAPPDLPALRPGSPLHFDLHAGGSSTFAVEAPDAGLYRLETTGLLDTTGTLRTRTVTSLATSPAGGTGRNFLLHQVLRSGSYQVTVTTEGSSAGHLALSLSRTEPRDGGVLAPGVPARAELDAGETVAYRFRVETAGDYRLRGLARDRVVRCRLEDGDGWPVTVPDVAADMVRRLEPGDYSLVLLPEPVAGRRLTVLERIAEPLRFEGHGPHPLPLATPVEHRWLEPDEGERVPDRWRFDLPAATTVAVRLTGEMEGELHRLEPEPGPAGSVSPRKGLDAPLPAGRYELAVRAARRDNDVPYRIEVTPEELVDGQRRTVAAPAEVSVAVAPGRQLELESFGPADVRATLLDPEGRVVASGDDRAGDWNFHLSTTVEGGRYTLRVDPVGAASATTEVRMAVRPEVEEPVLELPSSLELAAGDAVHGWPLPLDAGTGLLLVALRSTEEHGVAVDWQGASGEWATLAVTAGSTARLELLLPEDGRARLRVWSTERRGGVARLQVAAVKPERLAEGRLARGATLKALPGLEPPVAAAVVKLDRPGVFRLDSGGTPVRWSDAAGEALAPAGDRPLVATGRHLVVAADRPATVRLERLTLAPGVDEPLQLGLDGGRTARVDLEADGDGPLLVVASALVGQPLVDLPDGPAEPSTAATAVAPGRALAVTLRPRPAAVRTWWGDERSRPADVRLEAFKLPGPASMPARAGRLERGLEPGSSVAFRLPDGPTRLRLGLGTGMVAAVADGDAVESVHWSAGTERVEELTTSAGTLMVLNPGREPARFTLDVLAAAGPGPSIAVGRPLEAVHPAAGTLRLPVEPGDRPATLRLGGAAAAATFVGARGPVARGREILVDGPGVVLVDHAPGLVAAWLDPPGPPLAGLWLGPTAGDARPVEVPARLDLGGDHARFALTLTSSSLLELRSTAAAVVRLAGSGGERIWLDPAGGTHLAMLPPGPVEVTLRGLAGAPLRGELELTSTEVDEIGEGLGTELLLPPGAGRGFRFTVPPGPAARVGVAVRSSSPHADCLLLDGDGRALGEGVAQLHELSPGAYLLVVRLPASSGPARIRPAVVGLERPPTGPPDDVVRAYLEEAQR